MDRHLLIDGAAAIILVVAGGFFLIASWRRYARLPARPASRVPLGRAELVPLIGVPLFGLVLILGLIALANAGGPHPAHHHAAGEPREAGGILLALSSGTTHEGTPPCSAAFELRSGSSS